MNDHEHMTWHETKNSDHETIILTHTKNPEPHMSSLTQIVSILDNSYFSMRIDDYSNASLKYISFSISM